MISNYNEYYSNSATQITCWFFFTYPFNLHSISWASIMTNLHIFLSLSCCFLSVTGWRLSCYYRCFIPPWENLIFHMHGQKYHVFMTWKTPVHLTYETEFCRIGHSYLQHTIQLNGIPCCRKFKTLDICCRGCTITCSHGGETVKLHPVLT
jgi:hypothetical protein